MKNLNFAKFLILLSGVNCLTTIKDEDLMKLIQSESYVITLFSTKSSCPECDKFEEILEKLEDEFSKSFNGKTVKVLNSQLTRLYNPTKEPLLVFFRHGIPLLYNDVASEDIILHMFTINKDPIVKELNDDTFEHLTQAATGATTGDWFVMFYISNCVDCQRLQARWETVGAHLKNKMNVARVNIDSNGQNTASRFGVIKVPTFILFRQGKMYRYDIHKYDISSFTSFAQDWYKNVKPEKVSLPKSPFDKLIDETIIKLKKNQHLLQIGLVSSILLAVIIILLKYKKSRKEKSKSEVEQKKK